MPALSFEHLTDTEFEEFGFDLLHALKFVNVDWRKGTPLKSSPADSGRDIMAQQLINDIDGTKHLETWFVDCKHYAKGVPPTELQNLLSWAEAERPDVALFMVSGFLQIRPRIILTLTSATTGLLLKLSSGSAPSSNV